jgi:sortase A
MTRSQKRRFWRWIEQGLILGGVFALSIWMWSYVSQTAFQEWANRVFERDLHNREATIPKPGGGGEQPVSPPVQPQAPPAGSVIGRLSIPRLHLSTIIREGSDERTLALSPGHIRGTAMPGTKGNMGVAGHRDKLFRALKDIRNDDEIIFETLMGRYTYHVSQTEIVKPDNVSVLNAGFEPELTLVTCYPFYYVGSAPERFIVKARQVSGNGPGSESEQKTAGIESAPPLETQKPEEEAAPKPAEESRAEPGRVTFEVARNHSRKLAPGIYLGLTGTDARSHRVDGWMWVMPDRRTIWLRDQNAHDPVVFYGKEDGKKREVVITKVASNSISGYLVLPDGEAALRGNATNR